MWGRHRERSWRKADGGKNGHKSGNQEKDRFTFEELSFNISRNPEGAGQARGLGDSFLPSTDICLYSDHPRISFTPAWLLLFWKAFQQEKRGAFLPRPHKEPQSRKLEKYKWVLAWG